MITILFLSHSCVSDLGKPFWPVARIKWDASATSHVQIRGDEMYNTANAMKITGFFFAYSGFTRR